MDPVLLLVEDEPCVCVVGLVVVATVSYPIPTRE